MLAGSSVPVACPCRCGTIGHRLVPLHCLPRFLWPPWLRALDKTSRGRHNMPLSTGWPWPTWRVIITKPRQLLVSPVVSKASLRYAQHGGPAGRAGRASKARGVGGPLPGGLLGMGGRVDCWAQQLAWEHRGWGQFEAPSALPSCLPSSLMLLLSPLSTSPPPRVATTALAPALPAPSLPPPAGARGALVPP